MLLVAFVALILALWVGLGLAKRLAFGAFLLIAGIFVMADFAAAGGMFVNPENPASLRFITLDETPPVAVEDVSLSLTGAGYQARSITILSRRNDLAELREHIKYELRRGNITGERATSLNHLIDQIHLAAAVAAPAGQLVVRREARQMAIARLTRWQAKLSETLADTIKLVKVLGSVSRPEFAGTFIAAKIQVVRLVAEKAAVDGSIAEIRQGMKRPKAG